PPMLSGGQQRRQLPLTIYGRRAGTVNAGNDDIFPFRRRQPVGSHLGGRRGVTDIQRERTVFAVLQTLGAIADRIAVDLVRVEEPLRQRIKRERPEEFGRWQLPGRKMYDRRL